MVRRFKYSVENESGYKTRWPSHWSYAKHVALASELPRPLSVPAAFIGEFFKGDLTRLSKHQQTEVMTDYTREQQAAVSSEERGLIRVLGFLGDSGNQ